VRGSTAVPPTRAPAAPEFHRGPTRSNSWPPTPLPCSTPPAAAPTWSVSRSAGLSPRSSRSSTREAVRFLVLTSTDPSGPHAVETEAHRRMQVGVEPPPPEVLLPLLYSRATPREHIEESLKVLLRHPTSPEGVYHQIAALRSYTGTYSQLGKINQTTLILHGSADLMVDPGNAELLARGIPSAYHNCSRAPVTASLPTNRNGTASWSSVSSTAYPRATPCEQPEGRALHDRFNTPSVNAHRLLIDRCHDRSTAGSRMAGPRPRSSVFATPGRACRRVLSKLRVRTLPPLARPDRPRSSWYRPRWRAGQDVPPPRKGVR
jgi:hypothetical protein